MVLLFVEHLKMVYPISVPSYKPYSLGRNEKILVWYDKYSSSYICFVRIPLLSLNELGEKSRMTIISVILQTKL